MIDEQLFEYDLLEEEDGSTLIVETEQNKRVAKATLQKWSSVDQVLLPRGKLTRIVKTFILTVQR